MNTYSKNIMNKKFENISPDSFTGSLFAFEALSKTVTVLNGPTGCKFYHSAVVDDHIPRSFSFDPLEWDENFYFGQPRIPCTYLDGYDYVYGSEEKLTELLKKVAERRPDMIAVVNSPGAALIGDDLDRICSKISYDGIFTIIENTGFSKSFSYGLQHATIKMLKVLAPEIRKYRSAERKNSSSEVRVNLLGLNLYQKHALNNIEALRTMLADCNIDINCSFILDSPSQLQKICNADMNIIISSDYGLEVAKFLEQEYDMKYMLLKEGAPVGFTATESFLKQLSEELEVSTQKQTEILEKTRADSYIKIARFSSILGLPKGSLFSIRGESSLVYPLCKWLMSYLGMLPAAISLSDTDFSTHDKDLRAFLSMHGIDPESVFREEISGCNADIVFADGNTINQAVQLGEAKWGMEIIYPTLGYIDILPKTLYGCNGSLWLLENILNGLRLL